MAVSTNLGLYLPTREDYISVSRDLSNNYEIIDKSAGMLEKGIAIVVDGDTAPRAISSGDYLFIKNHSSLATGGYHATANIANGAAVTSSNTASDAKGVANTIKGDIDALNSKLPITYTNSKYCSNTEGTLTLEVPAGIYLVQICGKTQTSENFINMTLDDAAPSSQSYLGALIGTNTTSKVITAQTTNIVTYNATHTMTVSYSANWYRVQLYATLIQ